MKNKNLKTYIVNLISLERDEIEVEAKNKEQARRLARKIITQDCYYDGMEIEDIRKI